MIGGVAVLRDPYCSDHMMEQEIDDNSIFLGIIVNFTFPTYIILCCDVTNHIL